MMFSEKLINWYLQNKRDLPWRETRDPYRIWLSEIILQQTRVNQGMPYYERFTERFPTIGDLAKAEESEVMKLWQGLGYYSRARNLHATAKTVTQTHKEIFPQSYDEIIKLKGIGQYTAAAIASFAFEEKVGVVDGNVFRVLSRYFGIYDDISVPATRKIFQELANDLVQNVSPSLFNQAIMDFGALQCVPKNPDCSICNLSDSCHAFRTGTVNELPVKTKKIKVTDRFFNYLVLEDLNGNTIVEQRIGKGIWQNLYQFPLIEMEEYLSMDEIILLVSQKFPSLFSEITDVTKGEIVHKLSHQRLYIKFWKVKLNTVFERGITQGQLKEYAFPIVIWNFITSHYEK